MDHHIVSPTPRSENASIAGFVFRKVGQWLSNWKNKYRGWQIQIYCTANNRGHQVNQQSDIQHGGLFSNLFLRSLTAIYSHGMKKKNNSQEHNVCWTHTYLGETVCKYLIFYESRLYDWFSIKATMNIPVEDHRAPRACMTLIKVLIKKIPTTIIMHSIMK